MPHDYTKIIDNYLAAWNEPSADHRADLVSRLFTADVTYVDPLAEATGHDELNQLIGAAQQQFPGLTFTAGDLLDGHHDVVRFTWHLGPPGATDPLVIGFDVADLGSDGRITTVHGFLDRVPQT